MSVIVVMEETKWWGFLSKVLPRMRSALNLHGVRRSYCTKTPGVEVFKLRDLLQYSDQCRSFSMSWAACCFQSAIWWLHQWSPNINCSWFCFQMTYIDIYTDKYIYIYFIYIIIWMYTYLYIYTIYKNCISIQMCITRVLVAEKLGVKNWGWLTGDLLLHNRCFPKKLNPMKLRLWSEQWMVCNKLTHLSCPRMIQWRSAYLTSPSYSAVKTRTLSVSSTNN